uniref:Uncharacterized protein n=1 Tax=Panagrolaimus sp. ES5 TaxID=591445 RepID=A0AC34FLN9_9BILA
MPITREDPSLQSINEQQILLPSQSFEPSWPSCDQLTLQTLYPVEEDVTNVQETSINFPLHNSEDHLQFEPDIELNSRYNEDTTAQSFETSQANNQNYWSYPIEEVMESNNLARHYDHHIPENYNVPQTFVIYEIGQVELEREGIQRFDYNLQFDERFQQNAASSYISAPKEQQQFPDQQSHVVMDQNLNMQMNEQHNVYDESLNDDHQIWEQYPTLYKL